LATYTNQQLSRFLSFLTELWALTDVACGRCGPGRSGYSDNSSAHRGSSRSTSLATPNYSYEKRQRELAKKKKNEEKRQRKVNNKPDGSPDDGQPGDGEAGDNTAPSGDTPPSAA